MLKREELKKKCSGIKLLLFDCDGVFTDGGIILGSRKNELKIFSTKDGLGISLWQKAGFMCGCITGRTSEALQRRAEELAFDELHQGVGKKREVVRSILKRRKISVSEAAYIGDDLNDLPILGNVGIFFTPADANQEVLKRADWVLASPGGKGAVREVIDLILTSKNMLDSLVRGFLT